MLKPLDQADSQSAIFARIIAKLIRGERLTYQEDAAQAARLADVFEKQAAEDPTSKALPNLARLYRRESFSRIVEGRLAELDTTEAGRWGRGFKLQLRLHAIKPELPALPPAMFYAYGSPAKFKQAPGRLSFGGEFMGYTSRVNEDPYELLKYGMYMGGDITARGYRR